MGCEQSSEAKQPGNIQNRDDFELEAQRERTRFNKATGEAEIEKERKDKPEGDFFEAVDAGEGDQFMAVKPWIGAIKEPTSHPPINPTPPDARFSLEYVYGYRCEDSRQNVFLNSLGEAVYMTAALGVILNIKNNTQKFFGGGMVA